MKRKEMKSLKLKTGMSKKLCIFLMVVFTLVMAADLVNLFLTPAQSAIRFTPGSFERGEGNGFSMPEGGDLQMPEGGDFQMPEGGDFQMPGGDFQMPEGMGEMPSFEGSPAGNRGGRQGGFLQTVRSAWLPIALVCIAGDAVCLLILLRLRRREKALAEAFDGVPGMPLLDEEEEDSDEPPKRKRGPWGAILCMVAAFALILAMIPTEDTDASSANVHSQVISGTAEAAQINTVLSGAGTLEADTLTEVTIPQQVTVLSYHVRNGETVAAGDPLVSVDKTSASSAMMKLSSVLEDLDDDLEAQRRSSNASSLYSTASGRVKKIYASKGDGVTDVLYEHGALMLLSLDGTMKVTFQSDENLTVGQEVTVQYSGSSEEGRIAAVREGKVTVTLSDEKAPYGVDAVILDESGKTIGEGKIDINSALKVIGYYGKVKSISVSVGSKVSVGTVLMTLEETGYTADYQILLDRRNELEAQMQKLSQLARTGMVYAENEGIVSGVPDDVEIELLSGQGSATADNLSNSGGWQLVMLSNVEFQSDSKHGWGGGPGGGGHPGQGEQPDGGEDDDDDESETPTVLNGNYAAKLVSVSSDKISVYLYPTAVSSDADLSGLQSQMTQSGEYACSGISDVDIPLTENGETKTVKLADLQANDLLLLTFSNDIVTNVIKAQRTGSQTETPTDPTDPSEPSQDGATGEMPSDGMAGGMTGGMGSGSGMTVQKSYEQYQSEETVILYVSDQQEIAVTISVDELDILTLRTGLDAQVTLDAMKGQSFKGRIARISNEGTNDGGNTKFTVTVLLPREAMMLDGMNASVKVVTATSDAAVSIPAAALVEEDGKTWVYTTYDKARDTLGGLKEVETGASDGELVEILSGLEVGDVFYYRYADTVTYSFITRV